MKWIVENQIDGVLDIYWSYETDNFGKFEMVDLIPNGRSVKVKEEEKTDYV